MEGYRRAGGGQIAVAGGRRAPPHHARLLPRDQESTVFLLAQVPKYYFHKISKVVNIRGVQILFLLNPNPDLEYKKAENLILNPDVGLQSGASQTPQI